MTDQKNTFKPDYLCDNPICRDSAIEQLEGRKEDADELERLRNAISDHYGVVVSDSGPLASKRVNRSLEALRLTALPSVIGAKPDGG